MENLRAYIRTVTDFSEDSWDEFRTCFTELEFRRKDFLLMEGQVCKAVFFISSGLCRSFYNQDGKEINTAFYFENQFATNIKSVMTSSKSGYFIQACEKTKVVRLEKASLLKAYKKSPEIEAFGRRILELITAAHEEHSDSFKLFTPRQRFENLVLKRPDFLQRISLSQTASYLGISRETLSRFRASK